MKVKEKNAEREGMGIRRIRGNVDLKIYGKDASYKSNGWIMRDEESGWI